MQVSYGGHPTNVKVKHAGIVLNMNTSEASDLVYKLARLLEHVGHPHGVSDEVFEEYRLKILETV